MSPFPGNLTTGSEILTHTFGKKRSFLITRVLGHKEIAELIFEPT